MIVLLLALPGASVSCSSCRVDCSGTASIEAQLRGLDVGTPVEICIEDDCDVVAAQDYSGDGLNPIALRDIRDGELQPNQRFGLRITILDEDGGAVGTISEERTFAKDGSCSCLGFPYRWEGERFDRWD